MSSPFPVYIFLSLSPRLLTFLCIFVLFRVAISFLLSFRRRGLGGPGHKGCGLLEDVGELGADRYRRGMIMLQIIFRGRTTR